MFDEDGSLDPVLKFILWLILGVAIAKVAWKWLTQDAWHWVRDDVGSWFKAHGPGADGRLELPRA